MSNKVDKLFKDKLESHSLQPSAQAWEKVEARLGKKNKMVVWLRVAAALLLFGVLTFVGLNWRVGERKQEIVKKNTEDRIQKSEEPNEIVEHKVENEAPKKVIKKAKVKVKVIEEVGSDQLITKNQQPIINNEQPATNNQPEETQPAVKSQPQKGITLTYSLPSIKKAEPIVAVVKEEPKKTGVQRVLEIAREVKNGDSPLAELREAKDDIFALDFRKDKNKKH